MNIARIFWYSALRGPLHIIISSSRQRYSTGSSWASCAYDDRRQRVIEVY